MDAELKLDSIGQVSVQVADLDAAIEFYGQKLGLRFLGQAPPGLAFFDCGGVRLMISSVSEGESSGRSVLYFNVADIQDGYEALMGRGVEFVGKPHVIHSAGDYELRMAFFTDPGGNTMALMDERGDLSM